MNIRRFLTSCLLFISIGCGRTSDVPSAKSTISDSAPAVEITVAAASDLRFVLEKIISDFEQHHPTVKVVATFGSSGNFFAQLSNKAPFDLFLSADVAYPHKLIEAGLADQESLFSYAIGSLAVCVGKESTLDVDSLGIRVLAEPTLLKIAIANPKHAPYGRAAESALKHYGLYDQIQDRLVLGDSVAQTAVFIESGAADAGIIAFSLAQSPTYRDKLKCVRIPQAAHPPLEQGGVILSWAKDRSIAKQFCDFLISDRGQAIFKEDGFSVPEKAN